MSPDFTSESRVEEDLYTPFLSPVLNARVYNKNWPSLTRFFFRRMTAGMSFVLLACYF